MKTFLPVTATLFGGLLLAGCADPSAFSATKTKWWPFGYTTVFSRTDGVPSMSGARLLLMPPELTIGELAVSGSWSEKREEADAAAERISAWLTVTLETRGIRVIPYRPPGDLAERAHLYSQFVKLHAAVVRAILTHKLDPARGLPTKRGIFDWDLGPAATAVSEDQEADYALFVSLTDTRKTTLLHLLEGLTLLGGPPRPNVIGYASLVDLRSGAILWFHWLRLAMRSLGCPDGDAAERTVVDLLLEDLPP